MDAWTPGREGKGFVASDGLHLWPVDASGHPHHIEYAQETGSELPSQAFAVDRSGGVSSTDYARGGDRNPEYENMVASLHPDLHPAMQDTEDEFDLPDWHISSNGYRDDWNIHEFSDWFFVTADWHIESQVHNIGWTPNSPGKALISPEGQVHSWNIDPSTGTPDHIDVAKDQGLLDDRPQEYWSEPFGAMDYMSDHMGSYYIEPNGYTYNAYGNERDPKLFEADPRLHDQPEPEESEEEFDLQPDTWHEPNLRSDQSDSADQPASAISKLTFDAQDLGALPPPGTTHPAPGVPPPGAPSGHLDDILAPKHDDPLDELHEYMQQTPQAPDAPESSSQTFSAVSSPERIHWSKRILRALKRRIGAEEDKPYDKFETTLELHQQALEDGASTAHHHQSAADPEWLQDYIKRNGPHMYHYAADQDTANAIQRDGLLPHDVTGNRQWNGELTPRANSVYVGDANLAALNASGWGESPNPLFKRRPIFQVDLRKLDPNKINADEDQFWHREQEEFDERAEENPAWQIPAYDRDQHGTHGAWADAVPLNHPEHVEESMDQDPDDMQVGTMAYQGGIPPEAMQLLTHPEYQLSQDPRFRQDMMPEDAQMDAMEQEADLYPEWYEDEEEEQPAGVFGKTTHQLAWEPGNEGKGLLTPEGELHTWSDDEDDSLSHLDYMHAHGVKANELFSIDSDGTTDSDNPALPTIEPRFQKADPEDGMSIDEIYPGAHMGDPGEPNHNVLGPADNPEVPDWTPGIRTSMLDDEARDAYVQQSGDPYMYHTTDQANLGSIAKHGLLPWDDPLVPTSPYHGSVFQTRPGHVYLGQEDHVGRLYGQPNVRANLNNLDSTRIKGDEDHFYNTPQNTVQITDPQEAEYFRDMGQLEENEFSGTQKVRAADYFGVGPSPVDDPEVDDDPDLHDNLGEWAADHDLSDPDMVQHSLNEGTLTHEGRVPPEALELYHPEQGWIPATQWHQQGQTFSSISTILEKEDIWTLNDPNQRLGHQGEALSHNSLAKSQSPIRISESSIRRSTESDEVCPHCGHSECGEQCNCEHCSEGYNALTQPDPNAAAHEFSPGGAYGPGQIDYTPGEEVGSERVLNSANQQISHRNWDDGRPCNCGWGNPQEWPVRTAALRTAAIKEASKLDWLQGRPDLQTPEGQQWLDWAGKQAPKYDELLPWMTREWKKNRLFYDPKQAQVYMLDSSDRSAQYQSLYWDPDKQNTRYLPAWQTALEDPTSRGLVPATPLWDTTKQNGPNVQNHIGDWADWYHSKQRQGLDINSKHALGQGQPFTVDHMLDAVQQHKADKKAEEAAQQTYHTFPDGHTVQRITNSDQAQEEGERMHHCLASYGNAIDKGVTQAYSLRDPQGKPLVTTEIRPPGGPTDHVQYDYEHMIDPQDVNELAEDFPDREQEPGNGTLVQMQGAHDAVPEEEHQDMMHQWMNTLPGGGVDTSHYMIGTGNWVSTPQGGNTLNTREIRPPESDEEMEDPDYYDEDEEQPQEPVTNLAEYQDLMRGHLDSYEDRHGVSLYPDHYSILHDLHSMDSDPSTYGDPSPSTPEEQRSEAENLYENAWQDPGFPRTLNHPDWQNRSSPGIDRLRELYQQNAQMGTVYHQPGVDAHYIVNPSHPNGQVQHDAFLRNGFEPVGQAPWIGYPEVMASSHQGQPPGFVPYDQSEHPIQQPEQPMANVYNTPRGIWSVHPDAPPGEIGQDPEDEFIGQAPWTFSGTGVPGESSYHGNEVPPGLVPPQQSFSSIQDWVFA